MNMGMTEAQYIDLLIENKHTPEEIKARVDFIRESGGFLSVAPVTNEYIATTMKTRQITEEKWQAYQPTLKVKDHTTVGEIKQWYDSLYDPGLPGVIIMDDVHLIQIKSV